MCVRCAAVFTLLDGEPVPSNYDDEEWRGWFRRVGLLP
jgi:hypothetical protein